jgi:hypothetical protein
MNDETNEETHQQYIKQENFSWAENQTSLRKKKETGLHTTAT